MFEPFIDEEMCFRFRLKAPGGDVVAISRSFPNKLIAVSGISAVSEHAGMGLITDLRPGPSIISRASGPRCVARTAVPAERPPEVRCTSAAGAYRPAVPRRVPVWSGLRKVALRRRPKGGVPRQRRLQDAILEPQNPPE